MRADGSKNMAYALGTDDYRAKKKIMQAPGGTTTLSLGCDTSSPFEFYKSKNQNELNNKRNVPGLKHANTVNMSYQHNNAQRSPVKPLQSHLESNDTFHIAGQKATYNDRSMNMAQKPLSSNNKNLLEETTQPRYGMKEDQTPDLNDLSKNYGAIRNPKNYDEKVYSRSRSSIAPRQHDDKNINDDFSPKPDPSGLNPSTQSRGMNDFPESKRPWSGKKIVQPPGGASSFKLWG